MTRLHVKRDSCFMGFNPKLDIMLDTPFTQCLDFGALVIAMFQIDTFQLPHPTVLSCLP